MLNCFMLSSLPSMLFADLLSPHLVMFFIVYFHFLLLYFSIPLLLGHGSVPDSSKGNLS